MTDPPNDPSNDPSNDIANRTARRAGGAALARLLPLALLAALLAACAAPGGGTGDVTVLLTDAPATEATSLNVTFDRIELVPVGEDEEGVVSVPSAAGVVDVLSLRNGRLETLGEVAVPAGTYGQVRLIVEGAEIAFGEGDEAEVFDVKVPSGAQSGLKIRVEPPLVAAAGGVGVITLDLDAARAVVETPPGSGNYLLKPTGIRAVTESGVLRGVAVDADTGLPLEGAVVTAADGAGLVATAVTEADGVFAIVTLLPGDYEVEIGLDGYASLVLPGVAVSVGATSDLGEVALTPEPLAP